MHAEDTPNPLSAEAIVAEIRRANPNTRIQVAPSDHPIYQTGARVRLGLPTAESLARPMPEKDEADPE